MFDVLRALVSRFDIFLRRQGRVLEFSNDADCILRIAVGMCGKHMELSDGTTIRPGEKVCELHFWNEHIPPMSAEGPDLKWGLEFYRLAITSLRSLADYLPTDQALADVVALRGQLALAGGDGKLSLASAATQLGFDVLNLTLQAGRWGRFKQFWENIYSWALMWTFNPGTLRRKQFLGLNRYELWISRSRLSQLYGPRTRS